MGVVKRRVLRGLWRRLVGVGIIGTGLSGSGLYNAPGRAFFGHPPLARPFAFPRPDALSPLPTALPLCRAASGVRVHQWLRQQ